MKKFVTLALALVMALSLAAPALAFTDVAYDPDSEVGISLAIKLVDMTEGYVNVNFNAPPSNRGYVKNEVVCSVVSMFVPKGVNTNGEYNTLEFEGTNVSLYQDANFTAGITANGPSGTGYLRYMSQSAYTKFGSATEFYYAATNKIILTNNGLALLEDSAADQTYHFAIFGKVLADSASIKATLKGGGAIQNAQAAAATNSGINIIEVKDGFGAGYFNRTADRVAASANGTTPASLTDTPSEIAADADDLIPFVTTTEDGYFYYVEKMGPSGALVDDQPLFVIVTDKNFKCTGMYVHLPNAVSGTTAAWYRVNPITSGGLYADFWGVNVQFEAWVAASDSWRVLANSAHASYLLAFICKDVIWTEFQLNPAVSGQMKPEWWASNKTETASIDIEPWYAEVTVPPEIELEIPKTGDAMSALGFVLIALAGLAVVAVRKVKA